MPYVFTTPDHPQSGGREMQDDDLSFDLYFPTDQEQKLVVRMGADHFKVIAAAVLVMLAGESDDFQREVAKIVREIEAETDGE
jgi:hypothetical protein